MSRITGAAEVAFAAARIDFTDDASTNKRTISALFDDADKLVPDRSLETRVATRNLEIGVANAGQQHTDQRFISAIRLWNIFD
jgi:hypothetical protein